MCRLTSFGSRTVPAARQLLLDLLPAAAAAATPHKQLLVQLLQSAVGRLCNSGGLRGGEVLQIMQCLPLPSEGYHASMLIERIEMVRATHIIYLTCCLAALDAVGVAGDH
jgi:hypothetical protein